MKWSVLKYIGISLRVSPEEHYKKGGHGTAVHDSVDSSHLKCEDVNNPRLLVISNQVNDLV